MAGGNDAVEQKYALRLELVGAKVASQVFSNEDGVGEFDGHFFKTNSHCHGAPHDKMGSPAGKSERANGCRSAFETNAESKGLKLIRVWVRKYVS